MVLDYRVISSGVTELCQTSRTDRHTDGRTHAQTYIIVLLTHTKQDTRRRHKKLI